MSAPILMITRMVRSRSDAPRTHEALDEDAPSLRVLRRFRQIFKRPGLDAARRSSRVLIRALQVEGTDGQTPLSEI